MFVYSVRATTIKFFGVICVALATLITVIAILPGQVTSGEEVQVGSDGEEVVQVISYEKVKTAEDAAKFLSQFGWEVKTPAVTSGEVTIPSEFDKVFTGYNEIQKRQGLDLSRYKKKKVTRYTYEITNYDGYDGVVYANLIVYKGRVIAGDVCSADVTGFIHGFEKK